MENPEPETNLRDDNSENEKEEEEEKKEDKQDNKMAKTEEKKGMLQIVMEILYYIAVVWLIITVVRLKLQETDQPDVNPIKNVSQNVVRVKRHVPKPASLPDPPPSPTEADTGLPAKPTYFDNHDEYIFVGGMPGAGSSLMRAILDAHPDVRCSDGKDVLGRIMQTWRNVAYSPFQLERMRLGGVKENVLDMSMIMFLIEFIANTGPAAPRMCVKDPLGMLGGRYLLYILTNMKMVFVIRDVRAAAYSVRRRKQKKIQSHRVDTLEGALFTINQLTLTMRQECTMMGVDRCFPVRYEDLVLYPRETMKEVLRFLGLPWKEEVLHHYHYANKTGVFSPPESNDRVPISEDSLTSWVGNIPSYLTDFHKAFFDQNEYMGYDGRAFPPDYTRLPPYNWTKPLAPHKQYKLKDYAFNFRMLIAKIVAKKLRQTWM